MAHHGPKRPVDDAVFQKMKDHVFKEPFFGATGQYPERKLVKEDEGELSFGVAHDNGKVVLNFGTPVAWVGMLPEQAVLMAQSLLDHARQCTDRVLTLEIGSTSKRKL